MTVQRCQPEIAVATGDIVKRLRHFSKLFGYDIKPLFEDAADRIEQLTKALEPFAAFADALSENAQDGIALGIFAGGAMHFGPLNAPSVNVGSLREAARVLALPLEDRK